MKRRVLLQALAGSAALAPLGGLPLRAADKTVVYLTPGLDLPFWRYLSKGIENTVRAKPAMASSRSTATTARRRSSRTRRT